MVIRKIVSFDRLTTELHNLGPFTENAPCCCASFEAKEVLDYIYDELASLEKHGQLPVTGRFFEITFQPSKIGIRTYHKLNSIHVKSFACDNTIEQEIQFLLLAIPATYKSLVVIPEFHFITEKSHSISYYLEYNNS